MSGLSNVLKSGWHPPGKQGGKESWRGDFKGINQVAGWMGKGKGPGEFGGDNSATEHVSRPLTTLKDPTSFGPPPRNVNYHGGAALPNEITPHTNGLGAPLSQTDIQAAERAARADQEEEVEVKPAQPALPYRANTTGLRTDHLPPPPVHRAVAQGSAPQNAGTAQVPSKPKPSLPPRLPSRKETLDEGPIQMIDTTQDPPPYNAAVEKTTTANGGLNQSAISRLGKAGVSVPGLGIGESNPWKSEKSEKSSTTTSTAGPAPQLNELQARFGRMASRSPQSENPPAEGTTLEQKQAAVKTAQNFHKDPSTVTMADAQSAASTANNFRQRHQGQINSSAQKANTWNKKVNFTGRMNNFLEKQQSPVSEQPPPISPSSDVAALTARKPPPPPPPKKPAGMHAPPPVPLGTKPSFG